VVVRWTILVGMQRFCSMDRRPVDFGSTVGCPWSMTSGASKWRLDESHLWHGDADEELSRVPVGYEGRYIVWIYQRIQLKQFDADEIGFRTQPAR
jgi:hypothetical protein